MTTILYNPKAQNATGEAHAREWVEAHGEQVDNLKSVLEIEDLGAYAAALTAEDKIILLGGDGTLNRFADAIRKIELRVPVYFAPIGTGNDFVADIREKHPEDPILVNEYITNLPIVRVNGDERVFINGIGYGLDGYCCEVGDELQKKSDKPVNYSGIAIKGMLGKFKPRNATVTVDGETRTYKGAWLAPTMNGRVYGGGIMITPDQDRLSEDGMVSAACVYKSGRIKTLLTFPKICKGQHLDKTKMFDVRRGHVIHVAFDTPCALQVDGETYLNVSEYTVLSRKAAQETTAEEAVAEAVLEVVGDAATEDVTVEIVETTAEVVETAEAEATPV